jgi:hypothetical protein
MDLILSLKSTTISLSGSTQVSMTPEAEMTTGNNALYIFALPQQ